MPSKDKKPALMKIAPSKSLVHDVRSLIEQAREYVGRTVQSGLAMLYWQIGKRIFMEDLQGKRAEYGKRIISNLAGDISQEYGSGFSDKNLHRMVQFYEAFSDEKIVVLLIRQLSWTHFLRLIPQRYSSG